MGRLSNYDIKLNTLPSGTHTFNYHLDKAFFEMMNEKKGVDDDNFDVRDANIDATLTVEYRNDVYMLSFSVNGVVIVPCDRCLDDLELPVDAQYRIGVKLTDRYADISDDLMEIPERDELNVAYMMFDTVVLALPMKHVHPAGKCNRQMTALLKKHRSGAVDDEDAALENELIDEMESMSDDSEE